jgi:hypothetical protein
MGIFAERANQISVEETMAILISMVAIVQACQNLPAARQ